MTQTKTSVKIDEIEVRNKMNNQRQQKKAGTKNEHLVEKPILPNTRW